MNTELGLMCSLKQSTKVDDRHYTHLRILQTIIHYVAEGYHNKETIRRMKRMKRPHIQKLPSVRSPSASDQIHNLDR